MIEARAYRGEPPHGVRVELVDGSTVPLRHVVKHSPTGFSWGYGGSGPAELARCVLLDALKQLGVDVKCAACEGGRRSDGEGSCWECDGGWRLRPGVYQDFKFERVARWPQGEPWRLEFSDVEAWIAGHGGADGVLLEAAPVGEG